MDINKSNEAESAEKNRQLLQTRTTTLSGIAVPVLVENNPDLQLDSSAILSNSLPHLLLTTYAAGGAEAIDSNRNTAATEQRRFIKSPPELAHIRTTTLGRSPPNNSSTSSASTQIGDTGSNSNSPSTTLSRSRSAATADEVHSWGVGR